MTKGFIVTGEVVQDGGNVIFDILSDADASELKRGTISADALERINGGPYTNAEHVFDEYRERIASRAGVHWNANPMNQVVILGMADF